MVYLDSFIVVLKKKNLAAYKKMARIAAKFWMRHGALEYVETVGNDLNPDTKGIPMNTFPKLTGLKRDEVVLFSYIVYKNKRHRNLVNKKVMADSTMAESSKDMKMPFDTKKMTWGGFQSIVKF